MRIQNVAPLMCHRAGVYWGPDKIAFYNEKFGVCCEGAHPYLMGHGFKDAFPELGDTMDSVFDQAAATGQTADVDNMLILTERNGYLEEAYFIGQFIRTSQGASPCLGLA